MKSIPQDLKSEYDREIKDLGLKRLLLLCYIGIICVPLFNILDNIIVSELHIFFLKLRVLGVLFLVTIVTLAKVKGEFVRRYLFIITAVSVLLGVSAPVIIMILYFGGHESPYYAGLIIIMVGGGLVFAWTLVQGSIVFGIMYAGYLGGIFLTDDVTNWPIFINNNFFLLPCLGCVLVSLYIHEDYRIKAFLFRIELIKAKDTIQESFTELQKVDEMKTDFVSSVSHELRTPLTSVIGFATNARKIYQEDVLPRLPENNKKLSKKSKMINNNLSIIVSEGQRLTRLINDVLDISKMEAGKVNWNIQELNLIEICNESLSAVAGFPKSNQVEINFKYSGNDRLVMADPDRLVQVIANLMSNALKFTEQGHVMLNVEFLEDYALVSVQDTGLGISKEDIPEVFSKFKQVGDTLTNKPKGTGLGLSICKDIIDHLGGSIWVESELDKGSCFYFTLNYCSEEYNKTMQADLNKLNETDRI